MAPPVQLPTRKLGKDGPLINKMGFGLMGIGAAYGSVGTDEERLALLDRAWELGNTTWDTADAYGDCEDIVGKWFKLHPERRQDIFLASKFGLRVKFGENGSYSVVIDSTPEYGREACERSLSRLGVESIDLYYIHRLDEVTPIEKTVQALVQLKE
ncbi:putative aldo-keto reductase yakc protein [Phaeoacremonium minimum UCRPA7]|uniref:Putative aldo-keto reductase yakc protein n=1 Tax=Phaeoacremonium minimum (strain UCR-PA7) TaxID=1286976 RepID=R8B8V7_PHAM7|nr:putative aldo-keto reductase yakc protein [Phaeoacremonium minimum UCRPA7]EON95744.1 putative aldo-keto reductase yakc protein [Phaeoacremonium minimum UCRPA7]